MTTTIFTPQEIKMNEALDIMKEIRLQIERQAFMIEVRWHYEEKFHSKLFNGLGTTVDIKVHYHSNLPKVLIKMGKKENAYVFDENNLARSTEGFTRIFSGIKRDLAQKFSIGLFEVNFYNKKKVVF